MGSFRKYVAVGEGVAGVHFFCGEGVGGVQYFCGKGVGGVHFLWGGGGWGALFLWETVTEKIGIGGVQIKFCAMALLFTFWLVFPKILK